MNATAVTALTRQGATSQVIPVSLSQTAHPWMVIHDPSGDFLGRCFRNSDLAVKNAQEAQWEDGTIFWHIRQGDLRIWNNGRYKILYPMAAKKKTGVRA